MGVFISIISGCLGSSFWGTPLPFLQSLEWLPSFLHRPGDLIGAFSGTGVVVTCIAQIVNVLWLQYKKGKSVLQPVQDLLPFVVLAVGTFLLVTARHEFLLDAPLLTMGAVSCIFVEQVCVGVFVLCVCCMCVI
jgi:hypothetical protein